MATTEAYDNLLRALYNAVLETQKLTEQQHQRQLARYYHEDGMPQTQKVRVPDVRPKAEEPWREVEVPLLALLPPTSLKIKELRMGFNVVMEGFTYDSEQKTGFRSVPSDKETHRGPVQVRFGRGEEISESNQTHVDIAFELADPPEAIFRIIDLLNKLLP